MVIKIQNKITSEQDKISTKQREKIDGQTHKKLKSTNAASRHRFLSLKFDGAVTTQITYRDIPMSLCDVSGMYAIMNKDNCEHGFNCCSVNRGRGGDVAVGTAIDF